MKSTSLIVIAVVLLLLSPSSVANAQKKARQRSSAARPASSNPTGSRQTGVLSIETGVVVKSGEVRPIARTQFRLLDDSLENILRDAGITRIEGASSLIQNLAVAHYVTTDAGIPDKELAKAEEAIKPHVVAVVTTDFSGKAQFPPLPAKSYYLTGMCSISKQVIIWNLNVDLKPGRSSVILDQNNAATVFGE